MKIAFDAKRAYFNNRGLGNYSRLVIRALSNYVSATDQLFLFSPKAKLPIDFAKGDAVEVEPSGFFYEKIPSLWRNKGCVADVANLGIDVFHGLSNELPSGIEKTKAKTVITMHDVIFLKHPEWFPVADRYIFRHKYVKSCRNADIVVAISEGTKKDIIDYIGIDPDKIKVVYQSCDPLFFKPVSQERVEATLAKYNLPSEYVVTVSAIEERKNHKCIIKAIGLMKDPIPYVIIGRQSAFLVELHKEIATLGLENKVIFLHDVPTEDLPAIYSQASIVAYPSFYEGFGLPIVEAQCCNVPVVTSTGSCFAEVAGDGALFCNPSQPEEWAESMTKLLTDSSLAQRCRASAAENIRRFSEIRLAKNLMDIYSALTK